MKRGFKWELNQWWLRMKASTSSMPFIGSTEGSIAATIGCVIVIAFVFLVAVPIGLFCLMMHIFG